MVKKIPFEEIKNDILGKRYELSIVFVNKNKIKYLNKKYRRKNEATDILSFDLSNPSIKNSGQAGEIFICPEIAKIKAPKFSMIYKNYLLFLVIHGILHLKGLEHGDKMDEYELTYYSRYRRRYL
jgi:probable rRNA maturation factor